MEHGECVAGNPRIYGQMVTTLGKYSKFAGAGDKATVRQQAMAISEAAADDSNTPAAPVAEKTTLKAKRIKAAGSVGTPDTKAPDAPF
jgi:myo-inositol-1(or 4)-monophosphatase